MEQNCGESYYGFTQQDAIRHGLAQPTVGYHRPSTDETMETD